MNNAEDHRYGLFLNLALKNQSAIFGFTMRLLPNFTIAEDIMQDTLTTMWQKFAEFQEGSDFLAWAKQIVRYKVIDYISKSKNRSVIHLSDEIIENLSTQDFSCASQSMYDEALHNCVDKLKGHSREIVHLRYANGMRIKEIAAKYKTPYNTLAKQMSRIHHVLHQCIVQTLHAWEMSSE